MEGIERIKKLSEEQTDNNVKKVAEYLIHREDMNEKYLNEEKNLIDMWNFIKGQVKKKEINGCAVIDDEEVYGLAIHYFDETNEKLEIERKEVEPSRENKKENKQIKTKKEEKAEVPSYNDNDIVMKYKGRAITYKEFKEGTYLQLS